MFVVGITGGIGSGKSTVADEFARLGIDLIDADIAARAVVEPSSPALQEIADHFGQALIQTDGSLNRKALREIVFHNEAEKTWLEQLLHPLIGEWLKRKIQASQSPYCILVSPLLLETSQVELVDRVLVVDVQESTQVERTMTRDGGSEATVRAIIAAQIDRQTRLERADDVFNNEAPLDTLAARVQLLHSDYLEMAANNQSNE